MLILKYNNKMVIVGIVYNFVENYLHYFYWITLKLSKLYKILGMILQTLLC